VAPPGGSEPDAFTLDTAELPAGTLEFLKLLLETTDKLAFIPPVAFGQDEGSQRSGMTLLMRMFPLAEAIQSARLEWSDRMSRLAEYSIEMLRAKGKGKQGWMKHQVGIEFAPILPKDIEAMVNEVALMRKTGVMSLERAIEKQGVKDVDGEIKLLEKEKQAEIDQQREQMDQQMEQQKEQGDADREHATEMEQLKSDTQIEVAKSRGKPSAK